MQLLLDFTQRVKQLKLGGANSKFADMVNSYVLEHIDRNISTAELAVAVGVNRQYLCERFKNDTGMTVNTFITERKIDEAKRLLETSNQTVSQISAFLGFSSQSYFQNVFKKSTGMTPAKYRENI